MPELYPLATRPSTPGYWTPRPLPWRWASERLAVARNYWVASTLPDGRSHTRPVWGVWLDGRFCFDTGSRIATSLAARPDATVHLESGDTVVIVEGVAEAVTDPSAIREFLEAYESKYAWQFDPPPVRFIAIRPTVAFGWLCDPSGNDRGAIFGSTGTRWDFA